MSSTTRPESSPTAPAADGPPTLAPEALWSGEGLRDEVLCLDVRTPAEFREMHIPGARNVPLGDLEDDIDELRSAFPGKEVAVVCRTGNRAERACDTLRSADLHGARVLEGGMVAWQQAGLPVAHGRKAVSLERQVRIAAGSLVVLGVALGLLVHPGFLGLAAFVGAGLVFAGVTDTCGMAMMLARMPWNRTG